MSRLEDRWTARRRRNGWEPLGSLGYSDRINIMAAPNIVWAFCRNPETAPLTSPSTLRGYLAPGTIQGQVGERQCFDEQQPGGTHVTRLIEVVEIEPERSSTSVRLPGRWPRTTLTVDPAPFGTVLTLETWQPVWADWLEGPVWPPELETGVNDLQAHVDSYLERVKAWVEGGWAPQPR